MLKNSIKATIKKFEDGHREMWIGDCPIWGFKDIFNVHDITNKKLMIKRLTEDYPKNNNNMCFLQEEYPEVSVPKNRIKTKESAKILNLKYDEGTEYFYGDIASTNQNFIDCVELMKRLPRIHPAYLGTNGQRVGDIKNELMESRLWRSRTVTNFDELLFWLAEFDLSHIPLDIEEVEDSETPTPKNNDECHPLTNLKSLNPIQAISREDTLKERLEKSEESRKEESEYKEDISNINAWIKTKTIPNKELSAFSQGLIKDGKRPTKEEYYLAMAEVASTSGTCLRRRFGAVIVKNNRIVSTGYVGAPSGREHCSDIGYCFREHHKIPSGTMYEKCRSTHAEMNAIIQASKEEMEGATLYLVGVEPDGSYTNADCCALCKRVIINSGISKVVARQSAAEFKEINVNDWIVNDDSLDSDHKGY